MARGRPLSFDRQNALHRAMNVFWAMGYDSTQISDLTSAMGINPPSFYGTFGGKQELFLEAVDLYVRTIANRPMELLDKAPTVQAGLRAMMNGVIDVALSNPTGGCMLVLAATAPSPSNKEVWKFLKEARFEMLRLIRSRIERGVADHDLPTMTDCTVLAHHFLGLTQAVSFQARDGATRENLLGLVSTSLDAIERSALPVEK